MRILIAMDRGDFAVAESLLAEGRRLDRRSGSAPRSTGPCATGRPARPSSTSGVALAADPIDRVALSGLGTALRMVGEPAQPNRLSKPPAATTNSGDWSPGPRPAEGERDPKLPHQLGMACAAAGRVPGGAGLAQTGHRARPARRRGPADPVRAGAKRNRATSNMRLVFYIFYRFLLQARCDYHITAGVHSVVVHIASRSPERRTFERLVDDDLSAKHR